MKPAALIPPIKPYDWGSTDFIAKLRGEETTEKPQAEAWFGAHHDGSSELEREGGPSLEQVVKDRPTELLGQTVHERFGGFPFLVKILSAAHPLSVQVHPSKGQALLGRNRKPALYKDDNHKPELLVALTPFYALCGFRRPHVIEQGLGALPELKRLLPAFDGTEGSLCRLVAAYLGLDDDDRAGALLPWLERLKKQRGLGPSDSEYWVLEAHGRFSKRTPDPGLFFFVLLELLELAPGQGLFLDAGTPHAYLFGSGVEVMASSDNVVRAGMTNKHVDVDELVRITRFAFEPAQIIEPQPIAGGTENVYRTPADEFELSFLTVDEQDPLERTAVGPEILIVLETGSSGDGKARLVDAEFELAVEKGAGCIVPHGVRYSLHAGKGSEIVRVRVPDEREPEFRGHNPVALKFGTSGLRGLVTDITDLEAYINARGFVTFLLAACDAKPGSKVALGGDLRASTDGPERSILRAVHRAVRDAGFEPVHLGRLPTPALMYYAVAHDMPSIMVTGSHIPFDRNGIKFNKTGGEVLKTDEAAILRHVAEERRRQYGLSKENSLFGDDGMCLPGAAPELPPIEPAGEREYVRRYTDFFAHDALLGIRIGLYEHSAVGRKLLGEVLSALGASVQRFGRSDVFVPIDTEAVSHEQLDALSVQLRALDTELDVVLSTDGDSDRPLILSVGEDCALQFFSGDRVGIVTAEFLEANTAVVPVSATDAVEKHFVSKGVAIFRTKIGSPHVLAKVNQLPNREEAPAEHRVGWEANGGFLLCSDITLEDKTLTELATRDALLPMIAVLCAARRLQERRGTPQVDLPALFDTLPPRYNHAALLDPVPSASSSALQKRYLPADPAPTQVGYYGDRISCADVDGKAHPPTPEQQRELLEIRRNLSAYFDAEGGFGAIDSINFVDGIRIHFDNGDIAHLRASGNAPQLRMYAVADSQERAERITRDAVKPGGVFERMLRDLQETERTRAILDSIHQAEALLGTGAPADLIGCVCGSGAAQRFWQRRFDGSRERFRARQAVALHEDLPVNQALGVLLTWQRLRDRIQDGALVAFVFGEGSRATPFTETDNGQKPAIRSFVRASEEPGAELLPMVELALRQFLPVEAYLRRSGFDGMVIKWGDEVLIPALDLSGRSSRFQHADVVRFLSVRKMDSDQALNKDWIGVDEDGQVTAFIPRRPLAEMEALADRGLLRREGDALVGGVNLGSIALSRLLLDALLEEFGADVTDPAANRKERPDLDPQFFTALTIARIADTKQRQEAWQTAMNEVAALRRLDATMPQLLDRLRAVVERFEQDHGRRLRIVGMDFGDVYWGDIGQHHQIYDFYLSLLDRGSKGRIARALAGIDAAPDARGNLIVGHSDLPNDAVIENSVLLDCRIKRNCHVKNSVLLGTECTSVRAESAFDVQSIASSLSLARRGGSYRVVSEAPVTVGENQRVTSLFLDDGPPTLMRVDEGSDLRRREEFYDVPVSGNSMSFAEAHRIATETDPSELEQRRERWVKRVKG